MLLSRVTEELIHSQKQGLQALGPLALGEAISRLSYLSIKK